MSKPSISFGFDALGSRFSVDVWDVGAEKNLSYLQAKIQAYTEQFESIFSRFRPHSLIRTLSKKTGEFEVPADFVSMLRVYEKLYRLSSGAFSPCVGSTLESMGYDAEYSLKPQKIICPTPKFNEVCTILDDTHIRLNAEVLLDFGGIGKGYCVDRVADMLRVRGYRRFLVNGSGDIFYQGDGLPLRCGLEHPDDPTKVIGVTELTHGALAASGSNRRRWDRYHHIVNPLTLASPERILGTWVRAPSAASADALATCLFLSAPAELIEFCPFQYCILDDTYAVSRSPEFEAQFF